MQVSFKYQIDKFTISYLKYTLISASVQNIKKKTNICLFRKIATMKGFHLRTDITIKTIKIRIQVLVRNYTTLINCSLVFK